ncbi:TetR/AcrR family transcriptional regulator [Microbacterium sp. 2FI]|uniref:TetR/AcrR family transcriptional regulator n=1 Tax=Microbacterium sp. 2FI TaxID=2502193 RepID=UPI0010FA383C|nr:TetR/AcrR family transcriptional regulator [Microbacterium sp. 2FI]
MTTTTATTRGTARSARAAETRAAIVAAAREAFVSRGYRATSLRDVAAASGISHPGLLRHFSTKDELLAAVVAQFEADNESLLLESMVADEPGVLNYAAVARHNAEIPGYLELFAALTGEASTTTHPAHERMRERYARLRALAATAIEDAIAHDTVSADRDAEGEAIRTAAAWDGLQVLAQYLPERIDIVGLLEDHEAAVALPVGWRDADDPGPRAERAPVPAMPDLAPPDALPEVGYRVGRERRTRIVADAMTLFASEGYTDTSLREVAEKVGVSKSALLHHYPSKEALLSAVLAERDRSISARESYERAACVADELRGLPRGAADNARTAPGLIEVYAVLSCEAVPGDHPAHAYFEERYAQVLEHFAELLRLAQADGDLPAHRDPEREAVWLVALWDGLQYQWLYDRDGIDVAEHLEAHLNDLLPRG